MGTQPVLDGPVIEPSVYRIGCGNRGVEAALLERIEESKPLHVTPGSGDRPE